ncbi:hypothetical protein [Caldiplasma sukawensis]
MVKKKNWDLEENEIGDAKDMDRLVFGEDKKDRKIKSGKYSGSVSGKK